MDMKNNIAFAALGSRISEHHRGLVMLMTEEYILKATDHVSLLIVRFRLALAGES